MKQYTVITCNETDLTTDGEPECAPFGARWLCLVGAGDYSLWEVREGWTWNGEQWISGEL